MIVIFVAAVVAFATLEMLPAFLAEQTTRVIVSLLMTGICILGYKIPGVGYVLKFLTSTVASYKLLFPIVTAIASHFCAAEKLIIVQIISVLVGAAFVTKWQVDATEYTFLHTEGVDVYAIGCFFSELRYKIPKIRFVKINTNVTRKKSKVTQQNVIDEEKMKRQFERLKEERERLEKLNARLEREKKDMNLNREKETIGFFDGCENGTEMKARYRKLVQEYHPDGTRGNEEMFKKIQAEYERLTNRSRCQK